MNVNYYYINEMKSLIVITFLQQLVKILHLFILHKQYLINVLMSLINIAGLCYNKKKKKWDSISLEYRVSQKIQEQRNKI